jgi:hypothetical protein
MHEFEMDADAALARHAGTIVALEGLRGELISLDSGGAAVHVPDGFNP